MSREDLASGQRRAREDWRERVTKMASDLVKVERERCPFLRATDLRLQVVKLIRTALDTENDSLDIEHVVEGEELIQLPMVVRTILNLDGVNWRSPFVAESIMAAAERSIDATLATGL